MSKVTSGEEIGVAMECFASTQFSTNGNLEWRNRSEFPASAVCGKAWPGLLMHLEDQRLSNFGFKNPCGFKDVT
ncbi:MAG TPA: hypothetical protein DDZ51_17545 [Planctomycetaceae bacterium]|nr:hypothetical protein [Planctomycetaceae bacterium]